MPKTNNRPILPALAGSSKEKRKSNISLPERTTPSEVVQIQSRRNTITEENVLKPRKKTKLPSTPTIPENETAEEFTKNVDFAVVNETKKLARSVSGVSKASSASNRNIKTSSYTYDNKGYEGKIAESRNPSIIAASRAPSVQSLEIYREQYCCCAKRTKCERSLLITVTVLTVIIIVLVIVIVLLAKQHKLTSLIQFN